MRRLRWILLFLPTLLLIPFACRRGPSTGDGLAISTGLALSVNVDPDSDVAAVQFTVVRIPCGGESVPTFSTAIIQVLPGFHFTAPSGVPNAPFAPGSLHLFSDLFLGVEAGCYEVGMTPLDAAAQPSQVCSAAIPQDITVFDGQTTEVILMSQCSGGEAGAADIVATLNHAPSLKDLSFPGGKFLGVCPGDITQSQTICATASDPDGDPLTFTWTQTGGAPMASGPTVQSTTINNDGTVTQCVQVTPSAPGNATFTVTVFDMVKNPLGPGYVTWEQYYSWLGDLTPSHDALSFPSYAVADPVVCAPDGGADGGCTCTCAP